MINKLSYSILATTLYSFLLTNALFAQVTIKDTVYDDAMETLIGASVLIKGTITGTVTDIDGNFKLESPDSTPVLVVNYMI